MNLDMDLDKFRKPCLGLQFNDEYIHKLIFFRIFENQSCLLRDLQTKNGSDLSQKKGFGSKLLKDSYLDPTKTSGFGHILNFKAEFQTALQIQS